MKSSLPTYNARVAVVNAAIVGLLQESPIFYDTTAYLSNDASKFK
jgi:hypothetical protein